MATDVSEKYTASNCRDRSAPDTQAVYFPEKLPDNMASYLDDHNMKKDHVN